MADSKIKRRRSEITRKAWNLVRMALLWGRKGGVFKRWPLFELRNLFAKQLKTLIHHHHHHSNGDLYLSRQLSFDETPLFNVNKKKKMHCSTMSMRFLLPPCIDSSVDFEYDDFEMDGRDYSDEVRSYGYDEEYDVKDDEEEEEKGVDVRAEEFIAKFYEQIKLQRQISFLEYKNQNDDILL